MVQSETPGKSKPEAVSYLRLYSNVDALDRAAIAFGIIGSLTNGPVMPLFAYVFGEVRSLPRERSGCGVRGL